MVNLLEWKVYNDLEDDRFILKSVLDYIDGFAKDPCRLLETHEGYHALAYLTIFNYLHRYKIENENIDDIFLEKNPKLYKRMWDIFKHLVDTRNSWVPKSTREFRPQIIEDKTTIDDRRKFIFGTLLLNFNFLLGLSKSLHLILNRKKCIKVLLTAISDESFLKNLDSYNLESLVIDIIALSKYADSNKKDWQRLNCVEILLQFIKNHPRFETNVYIVVSEIATDKQIEELSNMHDIVSKFLKMLHENEFSELRKTRFHDDEFKISLEVQVPGYFDADMKCFVPITGVLRSLYHIAVNDKIKLSLYRQMIEKPLKSLILNNDNEIVKQHATQILAQLCFNQEALNDLVLERELCECISDIIRRDEQVTWKRLIKNCKQIEWLIKERLNKNIQVESKYQFDFMISYNSASRDLCLKIKKSLESHGYKVWIDVEQIHGSSIDSMAKAVESSKCILMCVTEKYRQSINCRGEAEYAFKHNKWIIPLVMQKGYGQVDGWLGFVMGSKIFIDFCKHDFETAFQELMRQIQLAKDGTSILASESPKIIHSSPADVVLMKLNQSPDQEVRQPQQNRAFFTTNAAPIETSQNEKQNEVTVNEVRGWNCHQVNKWLSDLNIDNAIIMHLKKCTGEDLFQMYHIQIFTPEFYYQMVNQINELKDPLSFSKFSSELKNLFEPRKHI